jgi:hypothetical protein
MPAIWTVNQVLPNGATVTADTFTIGSDGTTTEMMTATYPNGAKDHEVITTSGPGTPAANQQTLQQRAQNALVNNATYLAITTPTTAQAIAQVAALTRQTNAVIRVLLSQYDTTTGT